jgi:hypothetical protein
VPVADNHPMRRLLAAAAGAAAVSSFVIAPPAVAAAGPALAVDASLDRHPISPDVYGMNGADPLLQTELGLTADRWGGNTATRYNWTNNTSNTGSDWYYENIVRAPSESLDSVVSGALGRGVRPVVTVPMAGWVAKDSPAGHPFACGFKVSKYGAQQGTDAQWDPDCGNGVKAAGGNVNGNDPTDTSVAAGAPFVQSMVAHLVATHGDAAHGGVTTYELDNEPALWDDTHRDVHPASVTYDELKARSVATATAVKAADPGAAVAGPGDWGWCAYFFSPADSGGCGDGPDRQAHGGTPIAAWYLAAMKTASDSAGKRLLDVFDEHYYPQSSGVALSSAGSAATQALRLRSTRSLWDPSYTDESWIGTDVGAPPIRLIPWMREQVAAGYAGTRTSLSEYNWGGLESVNGALAQADVLGIFGRERLDAAMLWAPPAPAQPGAFAFRMYRDYDGAGGRFGETSVRATSADQGTLAAYAAQRASDGAVTLMVVNKTGGDLTSPVSLAGATYGPSAQAWSYSGADVTHVRRLADVAVSGGAMTATFAANSITLLVLPTSAGPPPAPAATALTASVSPSTVVYGTSTTASGRLTSGGAGVGGRPVVLEAQRKGTTAWTLVGSVTSAADGTVTKTFAPKWSATLRWRFAGDAAYAASTSPGVAVTVLGRVTAVLSPASIATGGTAYVKGSVSPAHPGGRYAMQQYTSAEGWHTLAVGSLSAASTYVSTKRPTTRGARYYRVRWLGDADHPSSNSPTVRLAVT